MELSLSKMTQKLGLISCLAYCVGGMIGSGLFIAPSGVLLHAGSTGLLLILLLVGAIFSAFGALVYIELGCWIPESGGGFAYLTHAGWHLCAVPLFWLGTFFTYPMFLAIQTIALGQLLLKTIESWTELNAVEKFWTEWTLGNGLLVLISVLNMFSISKVAARFQVVATILKILVVFVIVSIGIDHLIRFGAPTALSQPFVNSTNQPFKIVLGLYSSLFCYSGWEVLNVVLGEIQDPKVTLPIACIGAIVIVCFVSLAMNVAYFAVIEINAITQTSAVAVLFSQITMSRTISLLVPAAIALLICGNLNMTIFGASRYMQSGANKNVLPKWFGYVHPTYEAPRIAIVAQCLIAVALSFLGNLDQLISYMSYAELLDRLFVQFAFLFMRYKQFPRPVGIYQNPIIISVVYLLICILLLVIPLYQDVQIAIYGLSVFIISFLAYTLINQRKLLINLAQDFKNRLLSCFGYKTKSRNSIVCDLNVK
ncbi:hypothetical protein M3Y96_00936700 [Aphelenchoides besseyi]|nr:hypothetical protein M3Y96_00936700 [Aphelenchoides besseyi]